jgi:diaminopimelate decarboxylase
MWWANDFLNVKGGTLYLGDKEATKVAKAHGTPLFVYSKNQILSNFKTLLKAFNGKTSLEIKLYYAMKANPHQEILKILKEVGACIDAVSPGEVTEALRAGFSADRIFFTGTSVSAEDLKLAFNQDDLIVNIDAEEQLELMKEVRERWFKHKKIKIAVRWNPGIGRGFNSKVVTAGEKTYDGMPIKFGVEEKKVVQTFSKASHYGFIPAGLHHHLGSGWTKQDFEAVKDAVDKMVQKASEVQEKGFSLEFLDFGGGFGPQYSSNQENFPVKEYVEHICQKIKKSDLGIKTIAMEPGKYLVGDAGVLLVKVEYLKKSYNNLFVCVNAGTFNTVPRPAIYSGAYHHIINCSNVSSGKKERITIAGNLCETGDVFGKEIEMPVPKKGDILAVLCAGAYSKSMASNFNLREIPKEIII